MSNAKFNRFKLNISPFNTQYIRLLTMSIEADGLGTASAKLVGTFMLMVSANGTTNAEARIVLEVLFDGTTSGVGAAEAKLIRMRVVEGTADGKGIAELDLRHFKIMQYIGTLNVGDTVEIDTSNFTVTINGANAYNNFNGRFINITKQTKIVFEDGGTERNIEFNLNLTENYL